MTSLISGGLQGLGDIAGSLAAAPIAILFVAAAWWWSK